MDILADINVNENQRIERVFFEIDRIPVWSLTMPLF